MRRGESLFRASLARAETSRAERAMSDQSNTWSDERVELLRKLWTEGLSASQIAAELGGVTRNAVIGKVHRLGLSGRAKSATPAASRPRKAAPTRSPSHPMAQPSGQTVVRGNTA